MRFLRYGLIWGQIFFIFSARAYPTFIGYGYQSCSLCHVNPFGNGPLSDYGRAVGAIAVSGKTFWASNSSDEELALASNFLGRKKMKYIKPSADVRGLLLMRGLQTESSSTAFIPMQADVSLSIPFPEHKNWVSATLGYYPDRSSSGNNDDLPLISREHYAATTINKSNKVLLGMMDIPFGIRTADHTAYSRTGTQLTMNDQAHQLLWYNFGKEYDLGVSVSAGNLFQESDKRQKGASVFFEHELWSKTRFGFSSLYSKNSYRSRLMNAVHARIGATEGSAVLIEIGTVLQKTQIPTSNFKSYFLFENMFRISKGLHLLLLGEFKTENTFGPARRDLRIGPAIQYFPAPRLEIRADFQTTRSLGSISVEKDQIDLLAQVHLWF